MTFDVVIRNGDVVDGSGLSRFRADVAVKKGKIAEIGKVRGRGEVELDATGHVVTPGFIDGHTHMDAQIFWDERGSCSCCHGVTTVVMGHCGFTLAPASAQQSHLAVRNLERAEDISRKALAAGIDWRWETFAEYLDVIDALPKGINYASNIGHSTLRTYVMGERAFDGPADDDELAAMEAELRSALRAGAYGFTTSRSINHKTSDDRQVASRLASWNEVERLVSVMSEEGAGIFQITQDNPTDDIRAENNARLLSLGKRTGVPIAVPAARGGVELDLLDEAVHQGARIFGLTHSRGIGVISSFLTQLPFDAIEAWRQVRALAPDELRQALRDPSCRRQLVEAAVTGSYGEALGAEARKPDYDNFFVLDSPLPPYPTVGKVAVDRGVHPVEAMIDLALQTDLNQLFLQLIRPFDHEAVLGAMRHPATVMTFSDSGAHVSQITDCSIQTHLLAYWVRERGDFSLEEAIRMLTVAPSRAWGLHDRGLLREGLAADVNVFDPDTVGPGMPYLADDLPAGELRIKQESSGFLATLVNGSITHTGGKHTEVRSGELLRGPLTRRIG
jgi:N-acyl-D-amino-acid deacylase